MAHLRKANVTPHLGTPEADDEDMDNSRRNALRGAFLGFVIGLVFPVTAWLVAGATTGSASVLLIRQDQPVTWVIDLIPFVLAGIGAVVATAYGRFVDLQSHTAAIAERIADEWTHEIHDHNVEIARNAASQAKFFAALSHDMRTPLSAIIGFSSLVAEGEDDVSEMRTMAGEIRTCADQLLTMINDLLDAAKLDAGKIEMEVDDIEGDDLVTEVVRHMLPLADEKRLALETDLRAPGPWRVDRERLRQILINLISNAIKYTETGEIVVRSRLTGGFVSVSVEDTGLGISTEDTAAVFTPFEQTTAAQQRIDSTGLGLPVSLGLAEAMDGTITFHSAGAGCGSTFTLTVPRGTGSDAEARFATLPSLRTAA